MSRGKCLNCGQYCDSDDDFCCQSCEDEYDHTEDDEIEEDEHNE